MIHQKRRQELLSRLSDNAVVIVSSNSEQKRNSDVNYPFRPDSSFWYLTGFTEPDAIAVFSKKNYSIFLRPKDKTKEIWNGKRAQELRSQILQKFVVKMGRWREEPVGPHPQAMYQVAFQI